MTLRNDTELANSRRKLSELERLIEESRKNDAPGRATELRSLTRLANELREEISRYSSMTSSKPAG